MFGQSMLHLAHIFFKDTPHIHHNHRAPQRTVPITGFQRGNPLILMWPSPPRNAKEGSVQSIRRVDVYRVAEKPTAPLPLTEDQFSARAILIGSVPYDEIRKSCPNLTYTDTLELAGEPARLSYLFPYP